MNKVGKDAELATRVGQSSISVCYPSYLRYSASLISTVPTIEVLYIPSGKSANFSAKNLYSGVLSKIDDFSSSPYTKP